jgi:hypothetical protein
MNMEIVLAGLLMAASATFVTAQTLDFDEDEIGKAPKGNLFEAYLNGEKLFEVEDGTFTTAGKVGLWTKADSYTLFDDLSIQTVK